MHNIANERKKENKGRREQVIYDANNSIVNAPSDAEIALTASDNISYNNSRDDEDKHVDNVDNDALNSDEIFIATDDYE